MLPTTLTSLLIPLLKFLTFDRLHVPSSPRPPRLNFELRHLHAQSPFGHILFSDVSQQKLHAFNGQNENNSYTVQARMTPSFRPPSFAAFSQARTRSIKFGQNEPLQWDEEEIVGPDVESRETLLTLAKMTNNAYIEPDDPAWYDLGGDWNVVRCSAMVSCFTQTKQPDRRAILLGGNRMQMVFADTYLPRRIIKPSYCRSRVHRLWFGVVAGRLARRTSSTTTCFLVAVVLGLIGRGRLCATVIEVDGSVTRIV